MRIPRPSPALVIATLALLLAAGGGAYAAVRATGSAVNIVDSANATRIAKVSASGAVQVGGTVTATQAAPASLLWGSNDVNPNGECRALLVPPTGKALILTNVHIDVYTNPTPGPLNWVAIYIGSGSCSYLVTLDNPAGVGVTDLTFPAGIPVPAGSQVSALSSIYGSVAAHVSAFGYSVPASSVPATPETSEPQAALNQK